MGVDYLARKAAKKRRKGEEVKPRRERKKKQARRLCRGTCYQEPGLTADDVAEQQEGPKVEGRGGELAKYAHLDFGAGGGGGSNAAAGAGDKPGGKRKPRSQEQSPGKGKTAGGRGRGKGTKSSDASEAPEAADTAPPPSAKKPRLSTAVSLLDARTAKTEAPRQKQLAAAEVSAELLQFPEVLQRFMAGEGFAEPMPIQSRCWPLLLAGRDVEALAEPGSGKTLAYLLPAAALLAQEGHDAASKPEGPLVLILLPTRELAQQVAVACRDLRKYTGLRCVCITGGTDKQQQAEAIAKQPHILVATPGRLLDLVQDNMLQLGHVRYVVLDEADKMLGLGFEPQISQLKELLLPPVGTGSEKKPVRVQVGLFTATMPEAMLEVAEEWLHRPEHVRISTSASSISKSVVQVVQVCAEHKKPAKLTKHLQSIQDSSKGSRNPPRVLIFSNRIKTVRFLHQLVSDAGYRATLLHGERSQEEREAAVADFRSGKTQVLVATDVAARGLHIRNLPYVVNYDFPGNLEQYIHRVGRTGRLATDGHAFSFFTRELARLAPPLIDLLQQHGQAIDPNLIKLAEAYKIAAEKLGLLADATGDAPALPDRHDVLRSLGMKTQQQKKKDRQQERRQAGKPGVAPGSDSEDEGGSSGSGYEDEEQQQPQRRRQQGDQQPPAAAAGQQHQASTQTAAAQRAPAADDEPTMFIPSKTFGGARPGYAFKKGRQGVGYYLDPVQQKQQGGGSSKQQKPVDAAKQQHKQDYQQLKQKYSHAPIGGTGAGGSKPAAGGKARREQQQAQQQVPAVAAAVAVVPLLPGRVKELKRKRELAAATGQLAGFSSDDEAPPAAAPASKRHKALPGRLRKKLAKARAGKD